MSKAPEIIWARVKKITKLLGANIEKSENREWCEGYATQEIARSCGAIKYRRADLSPTREQILADERVRALVEALEEAIFWHGQDDYGDACWREQARTALATLTESP